MKRYPTPSSGSSPVRPARTRRTRRAPTSSGSQSTQGPHRPQAFCKFDEYMISLAPSHNPMAEDELKELLQAVGATEDTMEDAKASFDRLAEEVIQRGVLQIGKKPIEGEKVYKVLRVRGRDDEAERSEAEEERARSRRGV